MSWTSKYWDAFYQMYWTPKYLGIGSISKKQLVVTEDGILVPKQLLNSTGPLYRRVMKDIECEAYAKRQEETFNQIFNLAFAIVPGSVIGKIFSSVANILDNEEFHSFGRELLSRYAWTKNSLITQHDGFFVSDKTAFAIELKFNAVTSKDQFAKYCTLLMSEEELQGKHLNVRLLFIMNKDPMACLEKQLGFDPSEVTYKCANELIGAVKNQKVKQYLDAHKAELEDLLDRIEVYGIRWDEFELLLLTVVKNLGQSDGDRTLANLLQGLAAEVRTHPLSNV